LEEMRTAAIPALLSLLGTSWAASRNPSEIKLKWLEDEVVEGDTLPHMEITFADGTTDEIFLKPDPENDCFYHGSLKGDIESEVEVDGCKNDAEIVEISSRLVPCGLVILLLENGKTFAINPLEGIGFPNSTDAVPPVAAGFNGASWQGNLPTTAVAKIHVRYDRSIVDLFGSDRAARKKVKGIVDLSRIWFRRSRGLSMDIHIEVISTESYNGRIGHPTGTMLNGLSGRGGQRGHPTAWFKAIDPRYGGNAYGIAHVPGLCNGESGLISEVRSGTDNDASNAAMFAHELGHNLGMQHDFARVHRGSGEVTDPRKHYGPCNDKGIMSYQPPQNLPMRWSVCSRNDQEETFKKNTHSCMASGGGGSPAPVSGCQCNGKSVRSGRYQGAGSCTSKWRLDCGNFCFVDRGDCRGEFRLRGFEAYGYASCTPCSQSRNAPPLKTAECPNGSPSFIGNGAGLLAAGLLMARIM
jgi:hypothetical protein